MGQKIPVSPEQQVKILKGLVNLEDFAKRTGDEPLAQTLGCVITAHQMRMYGFEFVSVPPTDSESLPSNPA